jgi:phytol kinase
LDLRTLTALGLSYAYFLGLLFAAEATHRLIGGRAFFTRKAVLIGIAVWSLATVRIFDSWQWSILPPLTLAVLNYFSYRYQIMSSIEDTERVNLGAAFLPLSFGLLFAWLWRPGCLEDLGYIAVASLMAWAAGDTLAAIIGRRFGTRRYRFFGHRRTMEGTLALFLASSAAGVPILVTMGGMDWHQAVAFALIAGTLAALVEIVSLYGSDNLSVPLITAATLYLLTRLS